MVSTIKYDLHHFVIFKSRFLINLNVSSKEYFIKLKEITAIISFCVKIMAMCELCNSNELQIDLLFLNSRSLSRSS